jgi:hypothetical protein
MAVESFNSGSVQYQTSSNTDWTSCKYFVFMMNQSGPVIHTENSVVDLLTTCKVVHSFYDTLVKVTALFGCGMGKDHHLHTHECGLH